MKEATKKVRAHTRYTLEDRTRVPGVTTIVDGLGWNKRTLINWSNRIGLEGIEVSKFVDDKAAIGTLAHALITDKLLGKETDTSDYTKNQIDLAENSALSFWEWEKGHKLEPVIIEEPLVSEEHKFGGTLDIYGELDGVFEIIDLKSGSGIYPEHLIQVAAYKLLLKEKELDVKAIRILNIPRTEDEQFQEKKLIRTDVHEKIFLNCLSNYYLKKQI